MSLHFLLNNTSNYHNHYTKPQPFYTQNLNQNTHVVIVSENWKLEYFMVMKMPTAVFSILKMEVISSLKTPVTTYRTTWHHNPDHKWHMHQIIFGICKFWKSAVHLTLTSFTLNVTNYLWYCYIQNFLK